MSGCVCARLGLNKENVIFLFEKEILLEHGLVKELNNLFYFSV